MLLADSLLRHVRKAYSMTPQPNSPETASTLTANRPVSSASDLLCPIESQAIPDPR